MTTKAKRNTIAVLEQEGSSTSVSMKTKRHLTYYLVEVASVDRGGIAQKYRKTPNGPAYITQNRGQRILVIADADKQAAARRLFDAEPGYAYTNIEAIRHAILNEVNQ
jgi:hypothetical protein